MKKSIVVLFVAVVVLAAAFWQRDRISRRVHGGYGVGTLNLLGGNQADSVKYSDFSTAKYKIVGFRWLERTV